ncbi:hypothetical protein AMS68_003302 [Peltaster fructicola]|uniref:serine--tRNA ligase n=1 Tax=Peltaster fructicola TaxID=286661 RepID=A0A6H0XT10_9PEZI|nr:hypothetical protein AMS68_003302 [Peltaster fructicola]
MPARAGPCCLRHARSLRVPLTVGGCTTKQYTRPAFAPKPVLDLKHIRQNPGLYETNCEQRNYPKQSRNGWRILELHNALVDRQREALTLRQRNNALGKQLKQKDAITSRDALLQEAKQLKEELTAFEKEEKATHDEMEALALELPNLSSLESPVGETADVKGFINEEKSRTAGPSHVDIGKELDILDFEGSATTSGWGFYNLKNEGALLEQALVQYAISVALKHGWTVQTPPSLVYSHIAAACGFMPRDQHGETQVYAIQADADKPGLVLSGTAEIAFAGSQANKTFTASDLPRKVIGASRCYRAEAGARGVDTKGLYRVHEFTKVEMFAWTLPSYDSSEEAPRFDSGETEQSQSDEVFNELLSIQAEILTTLGLHARILEMPTTDLGASSIRKIDIEAFFPSRTSIDDGYGEVSSASMCTDYQARRLGTRLKVEGRSGLSFPWTINGTALAVPRVLLQSSRMAGKSQRRLSECPNACESGCQASLNS